MGNLVKRVLFRKTDIKMCQYHDGTYEVSVESLDRGLWEALRSHDYQEASQWFMQAVRGCTGLQDDPTALLCLAPQWDCETWTPNLGDN